MNYLRNFLHFRLILPLQRYVIIIIFAVARNILQHLNERRKLHTLVGRNAAGFKNHQVGNRLKKLVELEILALPDKTLAMLMNALAVRVCLLEHILVEISADLSLGLNLLVVGYALLSGVNIYVLSTFESAATETDLAAWFSRKIGLNDIAVDGIWHFAGQFHDILSFLFDRLRNTQHIADFLEHTVQLVVEVLVVVDYSQMWVSLPGGNDFLVQFPGYLQSLFVRLFHALGVVGCGVELFSAICGRNQMQYGIVAFTQLGVGISLLGDDAVPEVLCQVGGDIHRATVADDDDRLVDGFSHFGETVFQSDLSQEGSFFSLEEELLVLVR